MKNVFLSLVLPCLLLACQDKGEVLREKRFEALKTKVIQALKQRVQERYTNWRASLRDYPNPETAQLGIEMNKRTQFLLAQLEENPATDISPLENWAKRFVSLPNSYPKTTYFDKKACILNLQRLVFDITNPDGAFCGFYYGRQEVIPKQEKLYENENYEATLLCIRNRSNICAVDSLWINGSYSSKGNKIHLSNLKAGKQVLMLKVKAISTRTNLDTTFSFQHTFHVLPK